MNDVDISAHAEKIRNHRFTGYTNNMLISEIELFNAGHTAGLSEAVDALRFVAAALTETDENLRAELGKLGVEWGSDAGDQAGSALREEADFSEEASGKVDDSAQRIFTQAEAFNRAKHSLPEPEALRAPEGDVSINTFGLSFLGFESDHVHALEKLSEARQQALQVLDGYAWDSGEILLGAPELRRPERFVAALPDPVPESIGAGGGPRESTVTASAPGPSAPGPGPAAPSPAVPPGVSAPAPAQTQASGFAPPTASEPAATVGSGRLPQPSPSPSASTTVPSSTSPTPNAGSSGVVGGFAPGNVGAGKAAGESGRSQHSASTAPRPGTANPVPTGGQGAEVDGPARVNRAVPGTGAGAGGAVGATPHAGGGVGGRPMPDAADAAPLGRGPATGAVQPTTNPAPGTSSGAVAPGPVGRAASLNDVGGGVAALGAGGVAGALSGGERSGRGVGRSAPGASRSPHPLPVGDLPEEEARTQRRSERLAPGGPGRKDELLERAAPGGDDDGEHVRRYGVDDNDLFADQRMVAPDVIGDDNSDGHL